MNLKTVIQATEITEETGEYDLLLQYLSNGKQQYDKHLFSLCELCALCGKTRF